jgi:hypothetical protein
MNNGCVGFISESEMFKTHTMMKELNINKYPDALLKTADGKIITLEVEESKKELIPTQKAIFYADRMIRKLGCDRFDYYFITHHNLNLYEKVLANKMVPIYHKGSSLPQKRSGIHLERSIAKLKRSHSIKDIDECEWAKTYRTDFRACGPKTKTTSGVLVTYKKILTETNELIESGIEDGVLIGVQN